MGLDGFVWILVATVATEVENKSGMKLEDVLVDVGLLIPYNT